MPLKDFLEHLNIIDANQVKIVIADDDAKLRLLVNNRLFSGVIPSKPFPITHPECIIFKDSYGIDVCVLKNYTDLEPESKKNLEQLLNKMYFIPKVRKILKIETSGDEFEWTVITDKGSRKFRIKGARAHVIPIGNRVVITDNNDNVYEIEDLGKLDKKSRREIEGTL